MAQEQSKDDGLMSVRKKIAAVIAVVLAAALAAAALVLAWAVQPGNEDVPGNRDEFAKSIEVSAEVSQPPAVGETALLLISVNSKKTYARATLTIELPANVQFDRLPAGLRVTALTTPNPSRGGPRASGPVALVAGEPQHFQARLRATASGAAEISVAVTAPIHLGVEAGADYVFFTVE
jgi:hypothetical protein